MLPAPLAPVSGTSPTTCPLRHLLILRPLPLPLLTGWPSSLRCALSVAHLELQFPPQQVICWAWKSPATFWDSGSPSGVILSRGLWTVSVTLWLPQLGKCRVLLSPAMTESPQKRAQPRYPSAVWRSWRINLSPVPPAAHLSRGLLSFLWLPSLSATWVH